MFLQEKETSLLITIQYTRKGMNMERGENQYFLDMVYVPGLLHILPHFMLRKIIIVSILLLLYYR